MGSLTGSWMMGLCRSPVCSEKDLTSCALEEMFDASTCTNHLLLTGIAVTLVVVLAFLLLVRIPKRRASGQQLVSLSAPLHLAGVLFNGCLGLVYLGLGSWMLGSSLNQEAPVYLPHWWLVTLSQGFSLILISFAFSIRTRFLGVAFVRFWSVLLTIYAVLVFSSSVAHMAAGKAISVKACLDVLFLPGALLLHVYGMRLATVFGINVLMKQAGLKLENNYADYFYKCRQWLPVDRDGRRSGYTCFNLQQKPKLTRE